MIRGWLRRFPALLWVIFVASLVLGICHSVSAADRKPEPRRTKQQTQEVIRDGHGKLLGGIRPGASGRLEARDRYGKLLGRYDPKTNETRDAYGRLLTKGNTLSALVMKAAEAKSK